MHKIIKLIHFRRKVKAGDKFKARFQYLFSRMYKIIHLSQRNKSIRNLWKLKIKIMKHIHHYIHKKFKGKNLNLKKKKKRRRTTQVKLSSVLFLASKNLPMPDWF